MSETTFIIEAPLAQIRPGDVIAFGGGGFGGTIVEIGSFSNVAHVAIVWRVADGIVELIEATAESVAGVKRCLLSERMASYSGKIWWLPLSETVRAQLQEELLVAFLEAQLGKPYDWTQAIKAGLDRFDWLDITYNQEDFTKFFCSELVGAALEVGGALAHLNASELRPIDLCRLAIYQPTLHQLKGFVEQPDGYNSISDPHEWAERPIIPHPSPLPAGEGALSPFSQWEKGRG